MTEQIRYSRGFGKTDNCPKQCVAADFPEFREAVLADVSQSKGQAFICGPLAKGLHNEPEKYQGEKHWRLKRLAEPRRFHPLDFDLIIDGETFLEIIQWAHRFSGLGYTTASHTDDKPRFRAVFELDREVTREESMRLGQAISQALETKIGPGRFALDKSVYQSEQPNYTPIQGAERYRFDGDPISVDALLEQYPEPDTAEEPLKRSEGAHKLLEALDAGEDVHGALLRLVGRWVRQGLTDEEIRLIAGAALVAVAEVRGVERVEAIFSKGELQRMIDGARVKGFEPRAFEEILADCRALSKDSDSAEIEVLAVEAHGLPHVPRRRCHEAIKQATKIPLSVLKSAGNEASRQGEPDHRDIARSAIQSVGAENLLADGAFLWRYRSDGIWKPLEQRAEKAIVQEHIAERFEAAAITSNLVNSVAEVMRTEAYREGHEWNVGPTDAVACRNGEVVLAGEWFDAPTWTLVDHCREHYRTAAIPVAFDPDAKAPAFERFLASIFEPDDDGADKSRALLEMMGYSLMAHCRFERFAILVGSGANGKSVFLRVLEALLGRENISGVQPEAFGNKFQRAHLHNRLANLVSEIREGEQIDDAALKAIVSGEAMTVEHKFRDPFELRPFATCWFATNHLPHTRDFSDATFRRALVVPFNRKFRPGVDADPHLAETLIGELPGVLNLALGAFRGVLERGAFTEPASCEQAKTEWRLEADQAAQFVEERCERGTGEVRSSALYDDYRVWADRSGIGRKLSHKGFSLRLERLGFSKVKRSQGMFFIGLNLLPGFGAWGNGAGVAGAEGYRRASGW